MAFIPPLRQLLGLAEPTIPHPPLPLTVPHCVPAAAKTGSAATLPALEQGNPSLAQMAAWLTQLNQELLSSEQRLALLERLLPLAMPALSACYSAGILEEQTLTQPHFCLTMDHALAVMQGLNTAYQHILVQDNTLPPNRYEKAAERSLHCAVSSLELTLMEQRLRALRHQKLPPAQWASSSRIFFAFHAHMNSRLPCPALTRWINGGLGIFRAMQPATRSLQQTFLSVQLFGLFDMISWPVQQTLMVDAYWQGLDLIILPDDQTDLPLGWVIFFQGSEEPASFSRIGRAGREALLLNLWPIEKCLRQDQAILNGQEHTIALSPALERIAPLDRLTVIERWLKRLRPTERQEQRHQPPNPRYLQLYYGLMSCYTPLCNPQETSPPHPAWQVMDVSYQGMRVAIEESAAAPLAIQMGQLVIFRIAGEEEREFQLAYIVRLQRLQPGQILEIGLLKLAQSVTPVQIQNPITPLPSAIPGLLLHTLNGKWQVAIPAQHTIQPERYRLDYYHYNHQLTLVFSQQPVLSTPDFKILDICIC